MRLALSHVPSSSTIVALAKLMGAATPSVQPRSESAHCTSTWQQDATLNKQKPHPEDPSSKDAADHTLDAEATFNKASLCATAGAQRTTSKKHKAVSIQARHHSTVQHETVFAQSLLLAKERSYSMLAEAQAGLGPTCTLGNFASFSAKVMFQWFV